jgi:hypothetical protein
MARRLTDGERDIWDEMQRDAAPSMAEQVADWAGVTVDDVTESVIMRWEDTMRQEAPDWDDIYPTREPGGTVVPWTQQEALSDTIPF